MQSDYKDAQRSKEAKVATKGRKETLMTELSRLCQGDRSSNINLRDPSVKTLDVSL